MQVIDPWFRSSKNSLTLFRDRISKKFVRSYNFKNYKNLIVLYEEFIKLIDEDLDLSKFENDGKL